MSKKRYTIDDLAIMTGLSTRTIRSYLASGQLVGEKAGGAWRFTVEQFVAFLSQDMVRQSVQAKANALIYDFLLQERTPGGCIILDVPVEDEASFRAKLLERVDSGQYGKLRLHYRCELDMLRVILVGDASGAARLVVDLGL